MIIFVLFESFIERDRQLIVGEHSSEVLISYRWVPRLLTENQKQVRSKIAGRLLDQIKHRYMWRFADTSPHPESKRESKEFSSSLPSSYVQRLKSDDVADLTPDWSHLRLKGSKK
ncbi:hypothetical protein J6590_021418 [Homalodisca vitripennis]|nr:hypothetical protein J6590_021418 [Homalodisca vitripennis]